MNGFLPNGCAFELPREFDSWVNAAQQLPKLLVAGQLPSVIIDLSVPTTAALEDTQLERAMQIFSYLGNAYVWGQEETPQQIPRNLAVPWVAVAQRLHRRPMLSYASTTLYNWRLLNPSRPVELGNLAVVQNFLGGQDEDWFIQVHVAIEAAAAPAIAVIKHIKKAVAEADFTAIKEGLEGVCQVLQDIQQLMRRMYEKCDPHIYYHRLRPFLFGWFNNPVLPQGMAYEGCYGGQPQHFHGQTGAQSSIVPALDALLGIELQQDQMGSYLQAMRECMPLPHRQFIAQVAQGPSLRPFAQQNPQPLREAYNETVKLLEGFRTQHLELAARYVHEPGLKYAQGAVGTGGTSFVEYLNQRQKGTSKHLI